VAKKDDHAKGPTGPMDRRPRSTDDLFDLAKVYWRLLLETVTLSLAIWLFSVLGPNLGIKVPLLFFMPTAYTIFLAFTRDTSRDRIRAFSFSVLIGFIFLIILTAVAPLVYQFITPAAE